MDEGAESSKKLACGQSLDASRLGDLTDSGGDEHA